MTGVKSERRRQKPLMERKRRARINRSLEQLKDVIVDNNGGILPRLDKARILELTVEYLQAKTRNGQIGAGDERFKAGYLRCVNEVTSFLHDKVEDTRLTQIVQHLFTLTANIKSKVKATKTPASSTLQSDASSSITCSGAMMVTESSTTSSIRASPSQSQILEGIGPNQPHQKSTPNMTETGTSASASPLHNSSSPSSLTSSSSSPAVAAIKSDAFHRSKVSVIKSMTVADKLSKVRGQGHSMTLIKTPSSRCTVSGDTLLTQGPQHSFRSSQFLKWLRKQEQSSLGTSSRLPELMVSREVERASNGACSRETGDEKRPAPRSRRYGSVCSTHSGQSSTDSDISADEHDAIMTDNQRSHAHLPKKLDVDRGIQYTMPDSDSEMSESEVFMMDSDDEASSGNDIHVSGDNGTVATSFSNSKKDDVCDDAGDGGEGSRSPVWRPW